MMIRTYVLFFMLAPCGVIPARLRVPDVQYTKNRKAGKRRIFRLDTRSSAAEKPLFLFFVPRVDLLYKLCKNKGSSYHAGPRLCAVDAAMGRARGGYF
jgi:hypothetical protein